MKNWKFWALLIGLYLVVKMCGGCDGCGSSPHWSKESIENAIEIRLISRYNIDYPHVIDIKQTAENPPTYEFEYEYVDRLTGARNQRTGHCTFYEDGQIRDIN